MVKKHHLVILKFFNYYKNVNILDFDRFIKIKDIQNRWIVFAILKKHFSFDKFENWPIFAEKNYGQVIEKSDSTVARTFSFHMRKNLRISQISLV